MARTKEEFLQSTVIETLHNNNIIINKSEIFLHGHISGTEEQEPGIEYRSAVTFEKNLRYLETISEGNILIHMHTIGGEWNDGIAIYDTIKYSKNYITILAYAHARSMSSIILQAADLRILFPHTDFMIHYGSFAIEGTSVGAITEVELLKKSNNTMLEIYASRCCNGEFFKDKPHKYIKNYLHKKMMEKQEWYLSAEEAVYYGFADGVIGSKNFETVNILK